MRTTVSYHFPFFFQGLRGVVEVYPAGAYVTFGGVGAQIEAWRGPILEAIYKARLEYSRIRRDHSDDCFCLSCCCARVTSANPHGWPAADDVPDNWEPEESKWCPFCGPQCSGSCKHDGARGL